MAASDSVELVRRGRAEEGSYNNGRSGGRGGGNGGGDLSNDEPPSGSGELFDAWTSTAATALPVVWVVEVGAAGHALPWTTYSYVTPSTRPLAGLPTAGC